MTYITSAEIQQKIDWILASPKENGTVEAIVIRPASNQRNSLKQAVFSPKNGVDNDIWFRQCWKKLDNGQPDPNVQVAIMNARMISTISQNPSQWQLAGDQLFVDFDLSTSNLSPGDQIMIGEAILEITAEPHRGCTKFKHRFGTDALNFVNSTLGDQHRLRGIYAKIISAGTVAIGDGINKY